MEERIYHSISDEDKEKIVASIVKRIGEDEWDSLDGYEQAAAIVFGEDHADEFDECEDADETIAALEKLTEKFGDDYLQCRTADEIVILIAALNCYGRGCDNFDLEFLIEYPCEVGVYPDCHTLDDFAFAYATERELVKKDGYDYFDFHAYGEHHKEICRRYLQHVEYETTGGYYFDGYVEIYRQ